MAIKRKKGDCTECGKKDVYLGRVRPAECISCYKYKKAKQYQQRAKDREEKKPKEKKKKRIKPMSKKMAQRLEEYRLVRDKYLEENPICEVKDCFKPTTNLHHKAGREGSLLSDVRYFMSCCETCHPTRIHENPIWAEKNGYTIRIRKINKK